MTLLSPPYALGAAGQVLSGKLLRLSHGGAFRHGASGVLGLSGVLSGPPNTMGELALTSSTVLSVQPFRAVIQSSLDATAGQYQAINDAAVNLGVTAQHASQFRRSLVVVRVDDSQVSGVPSSAVTDRAVLEVIDGPLGATAAVALPALPNNALALGEILIPPAGQTVTLTPYNPRTTTRGGVLPVLADGSTYPGHEGAAPNHDGAVRWHPLYGLQVGRNGVWAPPVQGLAQRIVKNATQTITNAWQLITWDGPDLNLSPNSAGMWGAGTTGNNSLTAAVRGIYACSCVMNGLTNLQIRSNSAGSATGGIQVAADTGKPTASVVSTSATGFLLEAGGYISAYGYNTASQAAGTAAGYLAHFALTLIAALP